jgi:PAS domain S-box-containing protein
MNEYAVESSPEVVVDLNERKLIRVLHVDDDSNLLRISKQFMEMEGPLQVDTALSVEEALEKLEKEKYDIVVSDYQMPEKAGLEFLKTLRSKGNAIPFIMFTGKGREEVAIKALNLGASQYLNKTGETTTVYRELVHSITELVKVRKSEEALRESEEKLRAILSSSPDAITVFDLSGNVVELNQAALKLHGFSTREEAIGKNSFEFVSPQHQQRAREVFENTLKKGSVKNEEFTLLTKDGQDFLAELSASVVVDSKGNPTSIAAITKDITDRKRAEQRFLESQEKFAALFNGNPEATAYTDPDMHILDINPRFTSLFGYGLDEVKGKHLNDVVVPRNLIEEAKMLDERTAKGFVYHDTFRIRKDGSLIPVSVSAAPISIQSRLAGYIAIYKDISQRKRTEQDLQTAMKKLEMMNEKLRVVGGLSRHDIRNKLASISGNAYLARKELSGNSKVVNYLAEIETAVQQSAKILEFARAYEMLGAEELAYVDIEKTVCEATSLFANLKQVKVTNDCHGLTVLADSLLRQLFYNLIDNSLKHGEKTTGIGVHCEKTSQDELNLIYEDDGAGIAYVDKPKLFKEGYTKRGGTGYGLFLIKKMMEVYGWSIQETGEPDEGARFVITIPKTNSMGKQNYRTR